MCIYINAQCCGCLTCSPAPNDASGSHLNASHTLHACMHIILLDHGSPRAARSPPSAPARRRGCLIDVRVLDGRRWRRASTTCYWI